MGVRPYVSQRFTLGRGLLVSLGLALTGVGIVNLFIPGLPSTVFLLGALWAFGKSSPRLESWLLNHPRFGKLLSNWSQTRSITRGAKLAATCSILFFSSVSAVLLRHLPLIAALVLLLAAFACWFVATRPET